MSGAPSSMQSTGRIDFLDGLRGLAILMVIGLHYFAHIDHVPRSEFYRYQSPLQFGYFGVELFFIISGYVIFMTLDKTPNFLRFMAQRWIRLFPAMLVATLFIWTISHYLPYRPGGVPRLIDLLPGLTLLGASFISGVTGIATDGLERGFWSLYVEFRFYAMFGFLFFVLGRVRSFFALTALSALLLAAIKLSIFLDADTAAKIGSLCGKMLIGTYLPWFLFGMYIYLYRFTKHRWLPPLLVLNAIAYNTESVGTVLMTVALPALVFLLFTVERVQAIFRTRLLMFFGAVSYPLYLINDSIGRGMIRGAYEMTDGRVPFELLSFATLAIILIPAWLLAKCIEPPMQRWLKRWLLGKGRPRVSPPITIKEA